ncbi:MAG: 2-oxoacid:ferredoxin oxidoreductase subunit gamma [Ruminococcaceae bacterium]|nr:2-oxoacid:ferredoxin oxidoreductase subunit gamma [Oscillospiraceae bacterium]MBE6902960.1 2-oxoacid:ferredoxin oxidoreductase subunit gamma [Oscillospiraceae bacterium]MBQ4164897.1 2-oxoacid:acceptor oxidoreductase family protein [Oscillospiraceae bacterium]
MMTETILAGFGGQGILFAGKMLAYFGLMDNKEVSWLPSYGPEMRGGTANCSVCISDDAVGSPLVTEPDVLIVMNGPSYDKFINDVKPGGIAIIDSTLIAQKCERTDIKCFYVPSTQMAEEQGLKGMANIILIGKLIKETGLASDEVIKKALEKIIPPAKAHLVEKNIKAIELGKNA